MYIYILNLFLIIIYSFLFKNRKTYVIVCSIQLFLILAMRSSTLGVDLINYRGGYDYISSLSFSNLVSRLHLINTANLVYPYNYESGFVLLMWIISQLKFSFHFFLVICAGINIYTFGYFINKYSKIPWLSFIILCTFGTFTYFFGILRQSLALCFLLWSLESWINNNKKRGLVLFLISFLMHRIVFAMLPLYLFANKKEISKKNMLIAIILTLPFLLLSSQIYNFIFYLMTLLNKGYLGHGLHLNNLIFLLLLISFISYIFANLKKEQIDKFHVVAFSALIFALYFGIIGMYNDNFARGSQILNAFLIFIIPYIVNQYRKYRVILIVNIMVVLLLTTFYIYNIKDTIIVPYKIETENIIFK